MVPETSLENGPNGTGKDFEMEHIERELAGIATRLEQMERERDDEKRLGKRTPGGLLVPKTVTFSAPSTALLEALLAKAISRIDGLETLVSRMAKTQRLQQDAIEEICILGEYSPDPSSNTLLTDHA
jgi:hypothetical protein